MTQVKKELEGISLWAERYVRFMDDAVKVPGTQVGVGVDPIVGLLVPGAGDAITGIGSIALLLMALKEGVPTIWILRMVLNIGIDTILGMAPGVGDVFDLLFRSNRRNLDIIERTRSGEKPKLIDYVVVAFGILLAFASILIPIFVFWGILFGTGFGLYRWLKG